MSSLSRIEMFVMVARYRSFAKAARVLGLSTSAISKQIQNLESELRSKLLNRTTRTVSLTEEGQLFYEKTSRALQDIEEVTNCLNEFKTTPRGTLKISVPMSLGNSHLKTPIAAFARMYPEVFMDVSFDDRLVDIAEEGFDIVLRVGVLKDSSMMARELAPCHIRVLASPGYLENHGIPKTPEDLIHHNVLAYTRNWRNHEFRYRNHQNGREQIVPLNSNFQCDASSLMIEGACQGLGIIILPDYFVQKELASGQLLSILEDFPFLPKRSLYALYPPNRYLSTRVRLFLDHLHEYCQKTFEATP